MQTYDNIQFVCIDGRKEMKRIIPIILSTVDSEKLEWSILIDKKLV